MKKDSKSFLHIHDVCLYRKYIQVCVQNVSDRSFTLADLKLTEKQHASLELESLNAKNQQVSRMSKGPDLIGLFFGSCSCCFFFVPVHILSS